MSHTIGGRRVRNILRNASIMGAVLAVYGCAKSPESIAPSYVSTVAYQGYTCRQLGEEQARLSAALDAASRQQMQARANDVAGVLLIGLPVSTLSGDNIAPEVARLKGELQAVQQSASRRNCG